MLYLFSVLVITAAITSAFFSLAALRQGQENVVKTIENKMLAETIDAKIEELLDATAQIHDLTNSNLAAVTADLAAALRQISGLQELVASLTGKVTQELDPAISRPTRLAAGQK